MPSHHPATVSKTRLISERDYSLAPANYVNPTLPMSMVLSAHTPGPGSPLSPHCASHRQSFHTLCAYPHWGRTDHGDHTPRKTSQSVIAADIEG